MPVPELHSSTASTTSKDDVDAADAGATTSKGDVDAAEGGVSAAVDADDAEDPGDASVLLRRNECNGTLSILKGPIPSAIVSLFRSWCLNATELNCRDFAF